MRGQIMQKLIPIIILLLQINIHAQGLNDDFGGTWEGNWFNTTFQSTGPIYMEIYLNESDMTYTTYSDIGGNVFGGSDPAPTQGQGSYTNTAGVISFESQSPTLGNVSFSFDTNTGEVNIEAIPGGLITQFLVEGTATSQVWDLDYTLTFTGGGGATGTIDLTKTSTVTTFLDIESETSLRKTFSLKQNSPNPFNPNTTIRYSLPNESTVTITIYDMLGKEINQLLSSIQQPGIHSVQWNGIDSRGNMMSAGIYLYKLQTRDFVRTKKMVLMK